MNQIEINKETGEITIYHKFKIGDSIYVRSNPKECQNSQTIESIVAFVKKPLIWYTTGFFRYCNDRMINFFNDEDDTDHLVTSKISSGKFNIGHKVIWKASYFKYARTITDIEINIYKNGHVDYFYYLDGGEEMANSRYFGDWELELVSQ